VTHSVKSTTAAATAALAIAVGVAACGGKEKGPEGKPGAGRPPVTLGSKNFTEQFVLGQLYKQALEARGFRVTLKNNIGSSEITDKALTSGKIDAYPEYTGTILSTVAGRSQRPTSAKQAYRQAKRFEQRRGFTLTKPTPFFTPTRWRSCAPTPRPTTSGRSPTCARSGPGSPSGRRRSPGRASRGWWVCAGCTGSPG
jgi:glycine betaine/choline ABC-type transport system substrate-binding protein